MLKISDRVVAWLLAKTAVVFTRHFTTKHLNVCEQKYYIFNRFQEETRGMSKIKFI